MASSLPNNQKIVIRSLQYRDLEAIEALAINYDEGNASKGTNALLRQLQQLRPWYGLLKFLSLFPHPCKYDFQAFVAEQWQHLLGLIQISPFNSSRSTWRVERVLVAHDIPKTEILTGRKGVGSQLLRYCFESIWEARTWLSEININDNRSLALYRENGFQPLAEITYWAIAPELIEQLAQHEPDLPNLLPVSNADAQLLYQLDCVSMPPLLRQVFDRHISDFKTNFLSVIVGKIKQWFGNTEIRRGYVFESQRKAAIGYYKLYLSKDGSQPHQADLTVHPAYTWLYPQLLSQMAQIVKTMPSQSLELASSDYQPEREEYLEKIGAAEIKHSLLMSRSVWHKLRETKPLENLQLSEVLQGLQPARTPIPSRMNWRTAIAQLQYQISKQQEQSETKSNYHGTSPENNSDDTNEKSGKK